MQISMLVSTAKDMQAGFLSVTEEHDKEGLNPGIIALVSLDEAHTLCNKNV